MLIKIKKKTRNYLEISDHFMVHYDASENQVQRNNTQHTD